jgi:hypothetical protein
LRFGPFDPSVAGGSESWDVVLDAQAPGANYRYESPLDTFWGEVRGVWFAANGFALASSGIYIQQNASDAL